MLNFHRKILHLVFSDIALLCPTLLETVEEIIPTGLRRSSRTTEQKDYKAMHSGGGQLLSLGDTVVSKHMALNDHKPGDIEIKLLDFESNWKKRLKKETMAWPNFSFLYHFELDLYQFS